MKSTSRLCALAAFLAVVAYANLPHAFSYGGISFSNPASTEQVVRETSSRKTVIHEWSSPDGKLLLRSTETVYKNFPVREFLPELVCVGDESTDIIDNFRSICILRATSSASVRALRGTVCSEKDFEPVTVAFGGMAQGAVSAYSFVATEGRSSAQWMPWLGVDFPEGDGVEVAIGWSGAWRADCALDKGSFAFSASMVKTHFRLLPGETVRQPSVLVFTRESGVSPLAMQTIVHRFMLDEKCPRDAQGRLIRPILPITAGGGNKTPAMMRRIIDWSVANKMPFDCFWVDAGWNGPADMPDLISNCGNMWYRFVGDWRFNPTVHPDGNLAKVADAAHAAGMRMLLWMEPERCVSDPPPPVFVEHRDWLLPAKDEKIRNKRQLNVNLGNPAAREWVTETVSRLISENKLDIYRQDFNMNTLPLWQENDAPDRQGITEAKYIAGLYAFWDTLRARFPHLVVENCASGGRRLDFEAVSRSHSYCRTDYAIGHRNGPLQVLDVQNVTINTLAYQPFQGSETTPALFFDDYGFFSSVCAGSVFTPSDWNAGIVKNDFTPEQTAWFKKVFTAADRVRPFFEGDFYPLTDVRAANSQGERAWCAYQMHRSDLDAGFIICFRRLDAPSHVFTASLGGIDQSASYTVETYDGPTVQMDGHDLASFSVTLKSPRSFRLSFYSRAK
jgi:alpha-galactosidase